MFSPQNKKRFLFLILTYLIIEVVCSKNEKTESTSFVAPPESTIYKYWSFLDKRDYKNALKYFTFHRDEFYDSTLIYPIPDRIDSIKVDTIISVKFINKKTCEIYYRIKFYSYKDNCFKYFITGDKLVLTKSGWLIDEVLIQ
ncbi:MAG: hypothetical protein ABIL69_07325 [candidate division WOR-3 bacterium]